MVCFFSCFLCCSFFLWRSFLCGSLLSRFPCSSFLSFFFLFFCFFGQLFQLLCNGLHFLFLLLLFNFFNQLLLVESGIIHDYRYMIAPLTNAITAALGSWTHTL